MKIIRAGVTETQLTFIQYVEQNHKLSEEEQQHILLIKNIFIDWLYKTAGFYDKNVLQKDKYDLLDYTDNVYKYINLLMESYKNADILNLLILDFFDNTPLEKYVCKYIEYLQPKELITFIYERMDIIEKYIINKKVLIISCFATLIEEQIDNGNFSMLYGDKYKNTTFLYYTYPYKFCNTGDDNNIFETITKIKKNIFTFDFDICLLSCGADAGILSDFINNIMKKDVLYIGGHMPLFFGIFGARQKNSKNFNCNNYFKDKIVDDVSRYVICNIPDKYKPFNYELIKNIEKNGLYW